MQSGILGKKEEITSEMWEEILRKMKGLVRIRGERKLESNTINLRLPGETEKDEDERLPESLRDWPKRNTLFFYYYF